MISNYPGATRIAGTLPEARNAKRSARPAPARQAGRTASPCPCCPAPAPLAARLAGPRLTTPRESARARRTARWPGGPSRAIAPRADARSFREVACGSRSRLCRLASSSRIPFRTWKPQDCDDHRNRVLIHRAWRIRSAWLPESPERDCDPTTSSGAPDDHPGVHRGGPPGPPAPGPACLRSSLAGCGNLVGLSRATHEAY